MEYDRFNINIKDNIIIVTSKKNVTFDDLKECREMMENSTGRGYKYGMFRDALGYYDGYDFEKGISVYCSTLNEPRAIEMMQNYVLARH